MNKMNVRIESAYYFKSLFVNLMFYKNNLSKFVDYLPHGAKILDLNCGIGKITRLLTEKHKRFKVIGLDLSREMLPLTENDLFYANIPLNEIESHPLQATDYDAVVTVFSSALFSNEDVYNLIKKAGIALKPKGLLYLSCIKTGQSTSINTTPSTKYNCLEDFLKRALTYNDFLIINNFNQDYTEPRGVNTDQLFFYARKK